MSSSSKGAAETKSGIDPDDLPPLLKHIMSTGSMVEDIERQQRVKQGSGDENSSANLVPVFPDLTQPPPNHPAYRGASPQASRKQGKKSPFEELTGTERGRKKEKEKLDTGQSNLATKGVSSPAIPPQMVSGNLLPMFSGVSSGSSIASSQPSSNPPLPSAQKMSPETLASSRLSPRGDLDAARAKIESAPVFKTAALLTPADLLSSSSSSSLPSSATTFTQDQVRRAITKHRLTQIL